MFLCFFHFFIFSTSLGSYPDWVHWPSQALGCIYKGTLELFCMEPLRIGTYRLPFSTMFGTFLCRTLPVHVFTHGLFQKTVSLSIHQERENSWKSFPTIHLFFETLLKTFFTSKSLSYRQLLSIEFPLVSFPSVPGENRFGCLQESFLFRFHVGPTI